MEWFYAVNGSVENTKTYQPIKLYKNPDIYVIFLIFFIYWFHYYVFYFNLLGFYKL